MQQKKTLVYQHISIFLLLFYCTTAPAQFLEIGGFGGVVSFSGDVNEGDILSNTNAAFGGWVNYNISPRFGLGISFLKGTLEAKDRASQLPHIKERNLNFQSDLLEFALLPTVNIFPFYPRKKNQIFTVYIGIGFGVIVFNPTTKYNSETIELQKIGTEGQGLPGHPAPYQLVELVIPFIGGIKYSIGGLFNISLEVGYRLTTTDYLDDVSTIYVAPNQLISNGALAVALSNRTEEYTGIPASGFIGTRRGNSNNTDAYLVMGLRLSFNLYTKKNKKEQKIEHPVNKWF